MTEEETKQPYTGRTGIGHPNRQNRSLRESEGKIKVKKTKCPKCGHNKAIQYTNIQSPYQGTRKCTKCKKRT